MRTPEGWQMVSSWEGCVQHAFTSQHICNFVMAEWDEALPLDDAGRRRWLEFLAPEYNELAEPLREALSPAGEINDLARMLDTGAQIRHERTVAGPNAGIHPLESSSTHPMLTSESTGVLGFHNLEMDKNNMLTTNGKEVKLESGTQMLIRVQIPVPVQ